MQLDVQARTQVNTHLLTQGPVALRRQLIVFQLVLDFHHHRASDQLLRQRLLGVARVLGLAQQVI